MAQRTYTDDEVEAIFDRAIKTQAKDGTRLTHDELVSAASEVGISKDAIDSAARDLKENNTAEPTDKALITSWKRRARLGFARHLITYLLVNAMLAFLNFMTTSHFIWFPIVVLGWGIGIALHGMNTFFVDEERVLERLNRKSQRRARRDRWKNRGAEFDRAVDQGVRAILEKANTQGARIEIPRERVRFEGSEALDETDEAEPEPRKQAK